MIFNYIFLCYIFIFSVFSQVHPLVEQHPFSQINSLDEFESWATNHKLSAYVEYFQTRPEKLPSFLKMAQKILNTRISHQLQLETPHILLRNTLRESDGDVGAALIFLEKRAKDDLKIFSSVQRKIFKYAFSQNSHFKSHQQLNSFGNVTRLLKNWSLPEEFIDQNYEKAVHAYHIISLNESLNEFTRDEKILLRDWSQKYHTVMENRFSGHNQLLKSISFQEFKSSPTPRKGSIDEFIQDFAFESDFWWMMSSSRVQGESLVSGRFQGHRSRSLLRQYGPRATRIVHWPLENKEVGAKPILGKIHIAVNYDQEQHIRSLEILVKDQNGEIQPFMYERVRAGWNKSWLPLQKFNGVDIKNLCMRCHGREDGKLYIRPRFLKTAQDFKDVGYQSDFIISEMLKL